MPQLHVLARVAADVLQLGLAHLPHGLGGHAHHERARRHHLARRHHGPRAHLGVVLDHRAREHDGADPDAHVVADGARVHDAPVADGDALTDDARKVGGHVQDGIVLHVGVASHADVVVLVAAHDREGPDADALGELDVADDEGGGIDPRARVNLRHAAGHGADGHRAASAPATGSRATFSARLARATVSAGRAAIMRAHAVASAISASGGTTAESRPNRSASSASTARPVSSMSRARPSANRRASWTLEAMRPTFTPTAPSLARVDPMRMSHHSASTSPPPIVQPLMAAITGCSKRRMARFTSAPRRWKSSTMSGVRRSSSLRSAPPQKARSPCPVMTTARAPAERKSSSAARMPRRLTSLNTFMGGLSITI